VPCSPLVLHDRLTWLFHHAYAAHAGAVRDVLLDDLGLTLAQYLALAELERRPNLAASDLAFACSVTRQSMHRTMGVLAEAGYIEREVAFMDGRSFVNRLTPEGRTALDWADAAIRGVEFALLEQFEQFDREDLARLLREYARAIERRYGRPVVSAWRL